MAVDDRPAALRRLAGYAFEGREPRSRLRALSALRLELDRLEGELAADALQSGLTWSQIGSALGVSKQAAHRRHSHGAALLGRPSQSRGANHPSRLEGAAAGPTVRTPPALPTLSKEVQMALRLAQMEAAHVNDREVGVEHLLVSMLRFRQSVVARRLLADIELSEARGLLRARD